MNLGQTHNHSYWDSEQYFKTFDLIIIGSGIVGLSTAISFKEKHAKASVLVIDRGVLLDGASTKNAGFACFGSAGEILDDLARMPENVVWETLKMRWLGLQILKKRLKNKMDYQQFGGFELFMDSGKFENCASQIAKLNTKIKNIIPVKICYTIASSNKFGFKNVKGMLENKHEGQIDTGKMMANLECFARNLGVKILNGVEIKKIEDAGTKVELQSDLGTFSAAKVVIATNGFAKQLIKINDVKPARAQVLITEPIENLKIKGSFHFDDGYYYFRNIHQRILFGGGRNLDFKKEETYTQGLNSKIHENLEIYLRKVILPGQKIKIQQRWSGIMGIGSEKQPIIEFVSKNVLAAIRMGGMGIAIGSWVGARAAKMVA